MDKRVINGKDTRRKHSETLKRDLVERSLQPGASVSALAQGARHQCQFLVQLAPAPSSNGPARLGRRMCIQWCALDQSDLRVILREALTRIARSSRKPHR